MSEGSKSSQARYVMGFPVAVLATLLLSQVFRWLTTLVLLLWVCVWLYGLVRVLDNLGLLWTRTTALALAILVLVMWPPVSLEAQEDDIAEAVFRHQLFWASAPCTIYLSVNGRDPSDELLERLADLDLNIEPVSAAQLPEWTDYGFTQEFVSDKRTGEHGVVVSIESIRRSWINPCAVEVEGGYYSGPMAASGETYWVTWLGSRWIVIDVEFKWVS